MPRVQRPVADSDPPACYAMVQPGLEPVAADEITRDLSGDIKKCGRGLVVFRVPSVTAELLALRTTEDVFLLAWGSDSLTYKATDLDTIRKWTAKDTAWGRLFKLHHAIRPRPKSRLTVRLICQMQGEHGYRRMDALAALADGLTGKLPAGWQPAEDNAYLEIWLTIHGRTAVCGVRLSDRTMRHRTYKQEHVAASLRPTVAAAMVRLAGAGPGMTILDPFCGAGTILAEQVELARRRKAGTMTVIGGDNDTQAVYCARENLDKFGPVGLARWDARVLPLAAGSVDRIVSNPPFGKQLSTPDAIGPLYAAAAKEWDRVLKPGGRAVLLAAEQEALSGAVRTVQWQPTRQLRVRILGQPAVLSVWQKP